MFKHLLIATLLTFSGTALSLPAFPGAEGFGSTTIGGRGGKVIEVTNLNDSGTGSFRAAVAASGPRIVVFKVAGTIFVKTKINITSPFLTIAGQTAPGDGITLRNDPLNGKMPMNIAAHDVIMRYMRVRPGSSINDADNLDATDLSSYNIIIDHCSFSWATDEVFTTGGAHDLTVQWSIIAEGLSYSTHSGGEHSKGLHLRESGTPNISVHHNLLAHNYDRNPNINTDGTVDLVNNVFYNATRWTEVKDKFGEPHVNIVNNFYKWGLSSTANKSHTGEVFYYNNNSLHPQVYVYGNIGWHRPTNDLPQEYIVAPTSRWMIVPNRFAAPQVTTYFAPDAFNLVLATAGATKPVRDTHDIRVTNDVKNGTGKYIDDPSQVGGWQVMNPGVAVIDTDHDGMPDQWEQTYGLNSVSALDGKTDLDGDGYTNVEEFLNGTNPTAI